MKSVAAIFIALILSPCAPAYAQAGNAGVPLIPATVGDDSSAKPEPVRSDPPLLAVRPVRTTPAPHRFLDIKNSLAIGAFGFALAADSYSTQRGLAYPQVREVNPLARPFVSSRGGQAAYSGAGFALFSGGMYLAHRTGHHRIERIAPWIAAGWEGVLAGWNMHEASMARASQTSYH